MLYSKHFRYIILFFKKRKYNVDLLIISFFHESTILATSCILPLWKDMNAFAVSEKWSLAVSH